MAHGVGLRTGDADGRLIAGVETRSPAPEGMRGGDGHRLTDVLQFLVLGARGGANRGRIVELLSERPRNAHAIAKELRLNYDTVRRHLEALAEHHIVVAITARNYGRGYALNPALAPYRSGIHSLVRLACH